MTLNNAYKIYTVLHEREHQQEENESDRLKTLTMDEAIEELTHSLLQAGDNVRRRAAYHPPPQRDIVSVKLVLKQKKNAKVTIKFFFLNYANTIMCCSFTLLKLKFKVDQLLCYYFCYSNKKRCVSFVKYCAL